MSRPRPGRDRPPPSEPEPELVFEPVEDPQPRPSPPPPRPPTRPPSRPKPKKPKPKPKPPAKPPPPKPKPKPKPKPPRAVRAGAELQADILHRDRRGRVVGDRFAVLCPGKRELIHAVVTLSHVLSLSGVRWWIAGKKKGGRHLLEANGEGMAREMLSARLDAALDAFGLAALKKGTPRDIRLYVGGRGLFVPYTGEAAAWDVGGELPAADAEPPRLLDPKRHAMASWSRQPTAGLLPRMATRRRFRESSEGGGRITWIHASRRIFPALLSWTREAGLELSFALLRSEDGADSVLLHVEGLQPSDRKLFDGLPEVELLWDPQADTDDFRPAAEHVPPVLVNHLHELPVDLTAAPFLTDADRPVIFRDGGPPLVLDGPLPLTPGMALLRPELAEPPLNLRPSDAPATSLHLPLRLVRRGVGTTARRIRALLLTPSDLEHLALLRDHLPWAVTSHAQMAQFDDVAFVLLGEEARWNLPIGLPYWGDDAEGIYLVRGWTASPEIPAHVVRRAAEVADDEVAFLSPARLWCVPRQAFQPLAERIELQRDLSRVRLEVEAARFETEPVFPELTWPEKEEEVELEMVEVPRRPAPPATRSRLLEDARAAFANGEHEKAAMLFERAGEFVEAARIYDRMVAGA